MKPAQKNKDLFCLKISKVSVHGPLALLLLGPWTNGRKTSWWGHVLERIGFIRQDRWFKKQTKNKTRGSRDKISPSKLHPNDLLPPRLCLLIAYSTTDLPVGWPTDKVMPLSPNHSQQFHYWGTRCGTHDPLAENTSQATQVYNTVLKAFLLAGSLAHAQAPAPLSFLYSSGPPAKDWYHPHWPRPLISVNNEDNSPQICSQASLIQAMPQWRCSSSQRTLGYMRLTQNKNWLKQAPTHRSGEL